MAELIGKAVVKEEDIILSFNGNSWCASIGENIRLGSGTLSDPTPQTKIVGIGDDPIDALSALYLNVQHLEIGRKFAQSYQQAIVDRSDGMRSQEQVMIVTDFERILNATAKHSLVERQKLLFAFNHASAILKAGITLSEIGAGLVLLTSSGQDILGALTGLTLIAENTIIDKTADVRMELSKLRLNEREIWFDPGEIQAKGFIQALFDLYEAAGKSHQTLAKIFRGPVSCQTAIGLLAEDGEKFKSIFASIIANIDR